MGQMLVPKHDVLAAGFPCQPFSKSGFQRGMDEARGTLFWNICEILRVRKPDGRPAGERPQHRRSASHARVGRDHPVAPRPRLPGLVQADRLLAAPASAGARRTSAGARARLHHGHVRRQAELAHHDVDPAVPHAPVDGWSPDQWRLDEHLPLQARPRRADRAPLAPERRRDHLGRGLERLRRHAASAGVEKLPGFPVWVDAWVHEDDLIVEDGTPGLEGELPPQERRVLHPALRTSSRPGWSGGTTSATSRPRAQVRVAGPGRRRRWTRRSCTCARLAFAPSEPTYVPALVAITQTSILGDRRRRLSPREVARLQGLPEWFDFGDQPDAATYKQAGNGVNVGAAYHVFREHVLTQPRRRSASVRPTWPRQLRRSS